MHKILLGEIVNVLPVENGLIIVYILEKTEDTATVAYKMLSFENGKMVNIPKNVYELSKFGENYKSVAMQCKNSILCKVIRLQNGKIFLLDTDSSAKLIDENGNTVWFGNLEYRDETPASVAISNRSVWTCYKERGVLIRLNISTMREELRIGGGTHSPFEQPNDLFIDGENIFVCNTGANNIIKVNSSTYVTDEYKKFDEPIKAFIKNDEYEFVVLESGLYLLD